MSAPTAKSERRRVTFRGSHLNGAILDLPPRLADVHPSRLRITAGRRVHDVEAGYIAQDATVVREPGDYDE